MKLNIEQNRSQGDPYVIKSNGLYYMYATHVQGVQLYVSEDMLNWQYQGFCYQRQGHKEYWAPAVIEIEGKFYMYYSSIPNEETDVHQERIAVAVSDTPKGPFQFVKDLIEPFSIDAHIVVSGNDLYTFYSVNDYEAERAGTLIVVDKMISPLEMCGQPKVVVRATLDEEIFMHDRFKKGQHWHTLEGACYFRKGDYHYLMYSGNCYESEYYYIGYAVCHSNERDLTKLQFKKYPNDTEYLPLISKSMDEEGTGQNSLLEEDGKYYVFYHGRDWGKACNTDVRTARMCEVVAEKELLLVSQRAGLSACVAYSKSR